MISSMPLKTTKNKKTIVPVELTIVLSEPDASVTQPVQPGAKRIFLRNLSQGGQRGEINAQAFKSLITAAANVPLADELVPDAIRRLEILTGGKSAADPDNASEAIALAARNDLIAELMDKWTEGDGTAGAGQVFRVSVYPKTRDSDGAVFTNMTFYPLKGEEIEGLQQVIEAGDEGVELDDGQRLVIPKAVRGAIVID